MEPRIRAGLGTQIVIVYEVQSICKEEYLSIWSFCCIPANGSGCPD